MPTGGLLVPSCDIACTTTSNSHELPGLGDATPSRCSTHGGWPAESKYYTKVSAELGLGTDYVDWGGTSKKRMNE